jgi:MFS family permease
MTEEKRHDPFLALRFKEFRFFVIAKFFLTMALLMQSVILSWLIYEKTKDPLSLGLIGLTEAIPALSISLFGGHLADRISRRTLMIWSSVVMLAASIFITVYIHDITNIATFPIYLTIFFIGAARGLHAPTQSAFWAQLIPKDFYVNASTWNSSLWQIAAVAGPALGGLCYGAIGVFNSSAIVCVFIVAAILLYLLITDKHVVYKNVNESLTESLKAGVKFVFKNQYIISAISLDLFAVLFGGAVALLPMFADQILHVGPQGLGILRAAPAAGAVVMAAWLAYFPPRAKAGLKLLMSVAGFGLCMIGFALSANYILSLSFLFFSGAFDNVSVVMRSTILQTHTPDEMRGRVSSVNSIFVGSSNEIGAFESGVAAKFFGLIPSVVLGGCMTLLVVGVTYMKADKLRKLNL